MSLPEDFVVELNAHTTLVDGGAGLIGGSPTRYIRLSAAAQNELHHRRVSAATSVGASLADKLLDLAMAEPYVELLPDLPLGYTVVIPVMDRAIELERLLASVRASTSAISPRIIVVDDGSAIPAAIENVARKYSAEFLGLPENLGPAGARNAGLAQVNTEMVVFLDSDLIINSETIPTLLRHFADPKVAIAVPRVMALDTGSNWIAQYEAARSSLDLGPTAAAVKPRSPMAWASSAALVARKSALGSGFDQDMRVGEDVDLIWRTSQAGWRIRYEPAAIVEHEHRITFRSWFARKADYGSGAVPLAQRHPNLIAPAIMAPWGVALMASLIAQRKWSLPLATGIAIWAAIRSSRQLASAQDPLVLGVRLTARGIGSATTQTTALLLKHWWPLTAIACIFSARMRKAVLAATVIDTVVEYDKSPTTLDPVRFTAARRLDDIAYGAGVWLASVKAWNFKALTPEIFTRKN